MFQYHITFNIFKPDFNRAFIAKKGHINVDMIWGIVYMVTVTSSFTRMD